MSENSYLEKVAGGSVKLSTASVRTAASVVAETIFFILDRSGSMSGPCGRTNRLEAEKEATIAMLISRYQLGADDQLSVIAFDHEARLVLPFMSCAANRRKIGCAIRSIVLGGGTNFNPPLVLAKKTLPAVGRAHIVMLSDGHGGDATETAKALKKKGAIIETIGVGHRPSDVDESTLKRIASVLDGKVLYRFLSDADEMTRYFRHDIANRLVKRDSR